MEPAQLTIIVPVKDRQETVKQTLASIKAQILRPLHIMLVDNASTDGTLDVLQQWKAENERPDFHITVLTEQTPGAAAARNRALREVDTEWVMHFDSDDTMHPAHASFAMLTASMYPQAQIVGWDVNIHGLDGKCRRKKFPTGDYLFNCLIHGSLASQRYMARTELLHRAGYWEPKAMVWNDIELGARLLALVNDKQVAKMYTKYPTVDVFASVDSISGPDYHSRSVQREATLDLIDQKGDAYTRKISNLKRAILAGCYYAEGHPQDAKRLFALAIANSTGWFDRLRLRMAYTHTSKGLRGASILPKLTYRKP